MPTVPLRWMCPEPWGKEDRVLCCSCSISGILVPCPWLLLPVWEHPAFFFLLFSFCRSLPDLLAESHRGMRSTWGLPQSSRTSPLRGAWRRLAGLKASLLEHVERCLGPSKVWNRFLSLEDTGSRNASGAASQAALEVVTDCPVRKQQHQYLRGTQAVAGKGVSCPTSARIPSSPEDLVVCHILLSLLWDWTAKGPKYHVTLNLSNNLMFLFLV